VKRATVFTLSATLLSTLFVINNPVFAQDDGGRNTEASFTLDFATNGGDTQLVSEIKTTPTITDNRFTATLVLQSASDLVGVNCDIVFDNTVLNVVSITEAQGDLNFDGRANVADILTLGERFNASTEQNGFNYFNRSADGDSATVIDTADIDAVRPFIGETTLHWTSNPNNAVDEPIRESVEIFEDPSVSNANGVIDDVVVVLLPREHPDQGFVEGFGFDGDARIADITFEIINPDATEAVISFADVLAIAEGTVITTTEITNASTPQAQSVTIPLQ